MAISLTVAASSSFIGRVSGLDLPFVGEKQDIGAHFLTILRGSCDNDRGGKFQRAGFRIRVEKAGRDDLDALGIEYGSLEAHEEAFFVFRTIAEGEAVDGELVFLGGWPERELRGGTD